MPDFFYRFRGGGVEKHCTRASLHSDTVTTSFILLDIIFFIHYTEEIFLKDIVFVFAIEVF